MKLGGKETVIEDKRSESEQRTSGSLERIVGRLRKDYEEASKLQPTCQLNSTGWWYCEGRKITAEIALRTIGYEL